MKMTRLPGGAGSVKLDVDIPEGLIKAMSAKFVARVGILGSKTSRLKAEEKETHSAYKKRAAQYSKTGKGEAAEQTNAEIGLLHEKGSLSRGIPARSFLEMPLVQHGKEMVKDGKIIEQNLKAMIDSNVEPGVAWRQAFKELGIAAERVIQKAFRTGGFGDWAPNTKYAQDKKGSASPLIDTAQLRRSIISQVIEK